ncbi:MAG: carbamoyltransferase [Candidatus Hydrogenedentes bacterium]|nr:carbamoyltransferase [Candidatus Hydrogenedentota bacterium]
MNILGIGGYSHDSAAALVCDGQLVAAVAEERLTRIKHQGGVPRRAVQFCLDTAGISIDDIDHVCCYMRPGLRLGKRIPYRLTQILKSPTYSAGYIAYEMQHNAEYVLGMRGLCGRRAALHFMHHHPAHAASAFLVSPFEEAALLSIDYVGEWDVTWAGVGRGTTITPLFSEHYPNSLGVLYTGLTDYLGFARASDEYKVMGLASYGEPEYADEFRRIVQLLPGGRYRIDLSWLQCHYLAGSRCGYMSPKFIQRFGAARKKDEPIGRKHQNIAASLQCVLEETALHVARHLHDATKSKRLCLAGGVALNCSMNGRLLREGPFDEIFVQPAAGDDGIAIGAALQKHYELTRAPRGFEMRHAFWGPEHSHESIKRFLDLAKLPYEHPANVIERTADLLVEGRIVGWYQGRMEFGPRALGARSILADPTRADMKDLINMYVKHREEFRPFAPSCLAERAGEYFDGCTSSPFMLFVYPVKKELREKVPAITHVDGTARVQTVTRDANPKYYALIEAFERRRGVPMVLNTSFNVMGEPIVNTPADAARCFFSTGMDALVLGDFVLTKSP